MHYGDLEWKIALSVAVCPLLRTVFQTAVPHEWGCCCCPHMNQYYNNHCNHKYQYFLLLDKDWKYWKSNPNFLSWHSELWHMRPWLCKSQVQFKYYNGSKQEPHSCRFYYSGINHWNWMSAESFIWFTHLLPLLQKNVLVKYLFSHCILTTDPESNWLPQQGSSPH